jgi:endonuclease-8
MPEGDTIHKISKVLQSALAQKAVERIWSREHQWGKVEIVDVTALGKHSLIELTSGQTLRVHLGMHGRWSRHRRPHRPRGEVKLLIESEQEVFVCVQPKDVEAFSSRDKIRHPVLSQLGPDLLGDEPDWEEILSRAGSRSAGDRHLGEVLLDQRIACGLGNVYKNELCFLGPLGPGRPWKPLAGTSPYTRLERVGDDELIGLYRRGRALLQLNLGGWPRTTTDHGGRLPLTGQVPRSWVYGRQGCPCRHCGRTIQSLHQGLESRATHWCESCQPLDRWRNFCKQKEKFIHGVSKV